MKTRRRHSPGLWLGYFHFNDTEGQGKNILTSDGEELELALALSFKATPPAAQLRLRVMPWDSLPVLALALLGFLSAWTSRIWP